jgi:hypothetical protein
MALHTLLVGPDGKVKRVWALREPTFTPPYPAFEAAIVVSLSQWEYEPLRVAGTALPVCVTVSTNIHWR